MIIMLSGKQGSGKSTTIKVLMEELKGLGYEPHTYAIKHPITQCTNALLKVLQFYGYISLSPDKIKKIEKVIGTEIGRNIIDPDIWINCALNFVKHTSGSNTVIILDSVRFPNEIDAFPEALKVRLECPRDIRYERCMKDGTWREDEHHISETALDNYAEENKFDLVIDTSIHSPSQIADIIIKESSELI